jgi:hypothetical protein
LVGVEEGLEDPHDPNYDSDSQVFVLLHQNFHLGLVFDDLNNNNNDLKIGYLQIRSHYSTAR